MAKPEDPPVGATTPGAAELLEALQKSARGQVKIALKIDDLDRKLEGGLAELRATLAAPQARLAAGPDELLDAMDLLDQAARRSTSIDASLAEGLRGVLAGLDRHLTKQGLTRTDPTGTVPDPRLFRVVGSEADPSLPEGVVARVVRAAVVQGGHLLREGEVLTSRRPS